MTKKDELFDNFENENSANNEFAESLNADQSADSNAAENADAVENLFDSADLPSPQQDDFEVFGQADTGSSFINHVDGLDDNSVEAIQQESSPEDEIFAQTDAGSSFINKMDEFESPDIVTEQVEVDVVSPAEISSPDLMSDTFGQAADLAPSSGNFGAPATSAKGKRVEIAEKAQGIFKGMWASVFYSGRVNGKTVMITSASRGEGASTIAAGLAVTASNAKKGGRIALVDFNLRSPAIHKMLGLRQSPGLTEVLAEGKEPFSVAQPVNGLLDVYTVGALSMQSLSVLKSEAVEKFFNQLSEKYEYIIVDVASSNHYPDSQVLSAILREAVIVIDSDKTPREAVAQAKKRIESGGGKVSGLIMNKRTFPIPNFLYRRV